MKYTIFWFDYHSFRHDVVSLSLELDRGNPRPLRKRVHQIVHTLSSERWILEDEGTTLEPELVDEELDAIRVGYAFLIVLSRYLEQSQFTYTGPATLTSFLPRIGWAPRDADALAYGDTPSKILKPQVTTPTAWWSSADYRDHIRPTQANRCGWLSHERLAFFSGRLQDAISLLQQRNIPEFPNRYTDHSVHQALEQRWQLFEAARMAKRGLFIIYS